MALDARSLPALSVPVLDVGEARAPWSGSGGGASSSEAAASSSVDVPALWRDGDEGRMKRELVAWAKAVASMAIRESMQC